MGYGYEGRMRSFEYVQLIAGQINVDRNASGGRFCGFGFDWRRCSE